VPSLLSTAVLAAQDDVRTLIKNRVDQGKGVSIAVGVVDERGQRVVGYGRVSDAASPEPDGDTVFEIGSITKVFTSLLLADMIERGEVKPDDPVSKYLPASVKMPVYNGKPITLISLSMQVSGLPRLPNNMGIKDWTNPYAAYTVDHNVCFFSPRGVCSVRPERSTNTRTWLWGLLGHVLALRAGMSNEALVRKTQSSIRWG
jgi:CubicO group peptidase (beta-lactamase class C family)